MEPDMAAHTYHTPEWRGQENPSEHQPGREIIRYGLEQGRRRVLTPEVVLYCLHIGHTCAYIHIHTRGGWGD